MASVAGGSADLTLLRVDPRRLSLQVVDVRRTGAARATMRELVEQRHALAAVNGGFFDERGEPLGLLVHQGKRTNPLRRADWGIFLLRADRPQIRHTRQGVPSDAQEALQCGPRLVISGRVPPLKGDEDFRTAVGITREGQVLLAVTSRGLLSLEALARALRDLGCRDALNLDGGASSQMYLHAGEKTLEIPATYPVPSALVVAERE